MLRIYLLGNPRIVEGDRPRLLPTPPKVFELWAYLLLHRRQPLRREHLAYTLWPDVPEEEARANLRRHLHLLRRQLPDAPDVPWILSMRHTLQWNPEADCWLDVALVEDLDPETAGEAQWAALFDCYRGDLLTGLYADWVLIERERLRQRFLRLGEKRVARQRASGDLGGAIITTRRLLAHDPLREELYRNLMELYYRQGDRAAALRQFERCEAVLRQELGVPPMPETLALRDAILRGEEWTPLPLPVAKPPPPSPRAAAESLQPARPVRRRAALVAALLGLVIMVGLLLARPYLTPEPTHRTLSGPEWVQDTWLNDAYPDLPYDPTYPGSVYATYPQVHLQYWNAPQDRVLIRFDLSHLPPQARVEQAVFHLFLEDFLNEVLTEPRPATVSAFRLLAPWQPETATFNAPWSRPGLAPDVDFEALPLDGDALHGSDWIDLDVTGAVQDWLAHPDRNFGLVVMITAAPQGAHYWVDTTDYPLPDRWPRLEITYR